jgi:hypothetical protein
MWFNNQSVRYQVMAHNIVIDGAEMELFPKFADSMLIIDAQRWYCHDNEHTISFKTYFVCPWNST